MIQEDLFGETRIIIKDNPLLAGLANHILSLTQNDSDLLNGQTMGEIDRKLLLAIWYEQGLSRILTPQQKEEFTVWASDPKLCPAPEAISRARRYLAEHDYIRLPKHAIEDAERHRQRIARSVKG